MKQEADIKEIRDLAGRFSPEEIDACIAQQLEREENICQVTGPTEYVVSELAKAEFVRGLVDQGVPLTEAVRELARRICLVQKGFREGQGTA